ncbi:MAG TPA: hypothetical protein VM261_16170 [Kofleriaceae bacterium]|nr:hypothetical protein [Kofleriaceae bacterium]
MEESDLINLLSEPTWSQLDARLRDAIARNASNAPLVDVIRSPLTTLLQLWKDALPTLHGDPLAAERLRVTLQAASDAAALMPVAAAALAQNKNGEVEHQPGLLRLRLLAVLSVAAFRVQQRPQQALFSGMVIGGLALQCGPAELLARLEPYGASAEAYDNLIRLSVPPIVAAGVASRVFLRSHARDPVERARWQCIFEVLGGLMDGSNTPPVNAGVPLASLTFLDRTTLVWSIAYAQGIARVRRNDDDLVEISGDFSHMFRDTQPPELLADDLLVVGYTSANTTVIGEVIHATPQQITASFDDDVLWVGFVDRRLIEPVNTFRARVRAALDEVQKIECTAGESFFSAAAVLPAYDAAAWPIAEPPPRTATNQLPPTTAANAPSPGTPSNGATRGDRVPVVVLPVATVGPDDPPPPSEEELAKYLQALGRRVGTAFEVVRLPWVEDAGAVISSVPAGDDDPRVGGLLEVLARSAARTPGRENALWVAIVPGDADVGVSSTADAARGIGVATRVGLARCISEMLDERGAEASPSTTFNVGRVPVTSYRAMTRTAPAVQRRVRPPAARLRVVGRLAGTAVELLEPPREEIRGAGRGAPEDTGVIAVALDRAGAELVRSPIRAHRTTLPATFAALIPVSPEVDVVELRRGHMVLSRIERAMDEPTAAQVALDAGEDGRVTASWKLPNASRPVTLTVELSARREGDDWVPFTTVHGCAEEDLLPLWRSAGASRVRLVACDGWAAIAGDATFIPEGTTFGPVVIRRVNERTLWAEVPSFAEDVDWFTLVRHRESGRRLDLASMNAGEVRLSALVHADFTLSDSIDLGERDVYRRA